MKIEFGQSQVGQCSFCRKWSQECFPFRIEESDSLPVIYRVLCSYKISICSNCKQKEPHQIESMIHEYMDGYAGNK